MEIKGTNEIIFENKDIAENIIDNEYHPKTKKRYEKKWVAVDDLKSIINNICNHGEPRDLRFERHLLSSLSNDNKNKCDFYRDGECSKRPPHQCHYSLNQEDCEENKKEGK